MLADGESQQLCDLLLVDVSVSAFTWLYSFHSV